ncbi:MAG TPA: hypothetical protein VFX12_05895 [Vicinamibacterales bacterium]|nr:hypothetical protein [Vicinamibacterales bacterium]
MQDFEKLGQFYLGRRQGPDDGLLLYDSRDLVTHAVCVGMTGSGKTGLCIDVVEEAAIDGVPVIAIDPKGDIANLLLTFPNLSPADFRPWINEDDARRAGVEAEAYAAQQAALWTKGLAAWGEDGARIARLRSAADFAIYTPGSRAGLPVSILSSFAAPPAPMRGDEEAMAERAGTTATGVLTLAGVDATPRGRDHTFVSTILTTAWAAGRDLDLASLIQQIQNPPFQRIGVLELESFYPAKERFELAMAINNLIAAPGFDQWLTGAPLDPASLLYDAKGKPRVAIFSIAHLNDAERMFFVTLLLNQVVGWMRGQTGTTSLRALVYMDEILGYFPPVANPPSKGPLLTLLKQGRAFGVGVLLATQNPVDLDYKGLSNAGTWFIGRLQTDRDKARVLDGLEAAAGGFDRSKADAAITGLAQRVFLLHDVHEPAPVAFEARWALSYLRGPLSRDQIKTLMAGRMAEAGPQGSRAAAPAAAPVASPAAPGKAGASSAPVLPPGIEQYFLPAAASSRYRGCALGAARVSFADAKLGLKESRDVLAAAPITDNAVPVDWTSAEVLDVAVADLARTGAADASFEALPRAAAVAKNYAGWQKSFASWLADTQSLELLRHAGAKLTSHAGESERDFRIRVQDALRQARDAEVDEVRRKYAAKQATLEERLRRAQQNVTKESQQASQQVVQTVVSVGAALMSAFLGGGRSTRRGTLGRATTAVRGAGRSLKERQDIERAQETAAALQQQLDALNAELAGDAKAIAARCDAGADQLTKATLSPKRSEIDVQILALGWKPV